MVEGQWSLRLYVGTVIVLGLALLMWLVPPALQALPWYGIVFFALATILAEWMPVYLPRDIIVSVSFCVIYASLLVYGPGVASLVAALGALVGNKPGSPWYRILFNFSQLALSGGLAGLVYLWLGGTTGTLNISTDFGPLAGAAVAYFFINSTLPTIAAGLALGMSPLDIWLSRVGGVVVNYLALVPLGVLIANLYLRDSIPGVLLLAIPLALARFSFQQYMNMRNIYLQTIKAIATAVDAKDAYTKGHSERVREHSMALARELKLPEQEQEVIEYMALLHDTGKIGISEAILNKPGHLTEGEFHLVQEHPVTGARILAEIDRFKVDAAIVRHHHERFDGSGYPDGLAGEKIPLGARIIAVADAYDAMTSDRPYRKGRSQAEALAEVRACAGTQFDPQVVEAFERVVGKNQ